MFVVPITQPTAKTACAELCKNSGLIGEVLFTLILISSLGVSRGAEPSIPERTFLGTKAGDEITVSGVKLCWCPAGKFIMGSPRNEPERRPDEDQVEVTLTKGFWMAKVETTQSQWKRVIGNLPGPLTAELPEGDDFPVGNVNFALVRRQAQQQAGKLQR